MIPKSHPDSQLASFSAQLLRFTPSLAISPLSLYLSSCPWSCTHSLILLPVGAHSKQILLDQHPWVVWSQYSFMLQLGASQKKQCFCANSNAIVQIWAVLIRLSAWAWSILREALSWAAAHSGSGRAIPCREGGSYGRGLKCFLLCIYFECNQLGEPGHNLILPAHTMACSLFPCSHASEEQSSSGSLHWNSWLGSAGFRGICHHTHIKSQNVRGTKGRKQQDRFSCLRSKHAVPIHSSGSESCLANILFTFYTHWLWVWGCGGVCVLLLIPSKSPFFLDERSLLNWYFGSHHVMLAKC